MTAARATPDCGLVVRTGADGRLRATLGARTEVVMPTRCFPWTHPSRLISLRDEDGAEVALIDDLAALDALSLAALERALAEVGFTIEVTAIEAIDEEFELRVWSVVTPSGPRKLETRRDEWPRRLATGQIVIRDLCGDLYVIREVGALDAGSRSLLSCYVD